MSRVLWRPWAVSALLTCLALGCGQKAADNAPPTDPNPTPPLEPLKGDVEFSVPSRTFSAPFDVALSTRLPAAEIRYTQDGSLPTAASTLYAGTPLDITQTRRLVANVFVNGVAAGTPTSVYYVAIASDVQSNLPLVLVDTLGRGEPVANSDRDSAFFLFDAKPTAALSAPPSVAARAAVHVRGQTSAMFDKKSLRVELQDNAGLDADYALAGMPAQSDWVLYAPFVDKALIQNAFVYSLGPELGLKAPRFAFTELYLNPAARPLAASDYRGVYLLVETIKNAPNRLDLEQLDATDLALPAISGGYIFKFELDVAEPPLISCVGARGSACWQDLEVVDPSPLIPAQQAWLTGYVQQFHDTLLGASFADPVNGYAASIDVDSFVNYMVLNEVVRNLDAYIRSLFLYKGRNTKIFVGPLWDYNLIAGAGLTSSIRTDGWQHAIARNGDANGWWQRLLQDPAFVERLRARYRQLRAGVFSDAGIDARIDALSAPLAQAAERNAQRWPNLTQGHIVYFETPTAPTWRGQVDELRSWLKRRTAWLDQNW